MEVDATGRIPDGAVRPSVVDRAHQLAVQQSQVQDRTLPTDTRTPAVPPSAYSPSFYAQAAQYQLYTQSGALASILAQHHVTPVEHSPPSTDAVSRVEGVEGSTIDARA